jgi:hypothetical protein
MAQPAQAGFALLLQRFQSPANGLLPGPLMELATRSMPALAR